MRKGGVLGWHMRVVWNPQKRMGNNKNQLREIIIIIIKTERKSLVLGERKRGIEWIKRENKNKKKKIERSVS